MGGVGAWCFVGLSRPVAESRNELRALVVVYITGNRELFAYVSA